VLGDLYWTAAIRELDPEPFPSLADVAWLAFYPLTYVGLVLAARRQLPKLRAEAWLDGLIVGLATASVAAAFVLPPILRTAEGGFAAVAVNLAYPVGDIALLSVVVTVMSWFSWRPARYWWFLAGGAATFAVVDTIYLVQVAQDSYAEGTAADTLWPLALFLVAMAGWVQNPARKPPRVTSRLASGLPVVAGVTALGLLIADREFAVPVAATVLAGLTVLAVVARSLLSARVLRSLGESRHQARTDELTGLGNRRLLYQTLERHLPARGPDDAVGLLLLDVDRFKEVNDSLGHHAGDRMLQAIGPRLNLSVRRGDVVVRLGGDEFAVVLAGPVDAAIALQVARRVRALLAAPFELEGINVRIDASVGVALAPHHGDDAATLLRHADTAMYEAKTSKSGVALYLPEHDHTGRQRLEDIQALRTAVGRGTLEVHFQPICDVETGAPLSMEALARWTRRGVAVPPDEFIPLAEQIGLISAVTDFVLDRALAGYATWRDSQPDVAVSVNLSPADLMDERLADRVRAALARAEVPGEALIVEITENTLMTDPVRARSTIEDLHGLGVHVAIDDFGTGYSSLAYLRNLRVDQLKLDRSFITDLQTDSHISAIAASTVALAHSLGLRFVAEGVETAAVRDALKLMGADAAQGWHFARPMPVGDAGTWLHQFDDPLPIAAVG
jgi:diguanylate cyclase (GGDEF)-like protein